MHKRVILLTKADSVTTAREKADAFMLQHGGDESKHSAWDWYVIGGRWSGTLNLLNKDFEKKAREIVPNNAHGFISTDDVERAKPELQRAWKEIGGTGRNPWARDQYSNEPEYDDIVPLNECEVVLNDWKQEPLKCAIKEVKAWWDNWVSEKTFKQIWNSKWSLKYTGRDVFSFLFQRFFFDCNIFNIESNNYSIPLDKNGWYAVMIDMHN